jgi:hypothetical protein
LTTIACNREALYGDLQFTNNVTGNKWKGKTKVYKFKANPATYAECDFIVGFCGSASDIVEIATFFTHPEMFDKQPRVRGISGLVLTANKDIYIFDDYGKWLAMDVDFAAIGSGANYAIGAMENGASPRDAVRAAMKHDAFTGYGTKGYSW